MPRATWEGAILAQSGNCEVVEGNQYFPPDSLRPEFFAPSSHTTICHWKGTAHYYDVVVDGKRNENVAWFYPEPKAAAKQIKGYVAFWRGVRVEP